MSLSVTCDECGHLVAGAVHARGIMRIDGSGELRLTSPAMHYHWPCLLAWALRTAAQEKVTIPLAAVPERG